MTSSPKSMTTEEIYEIYDEIFSNMTFYVDKKNKTQVYAEYKVSYDDNDGESKNYYEFLNINDRAFVADVRLAFIAQTGEHYAPPFKTVIQRYADKAIAHKNTVDINKRLAGSENSITYFFGDDKNRIVYIDKEGVRLRKRSKKYKFLKTDNTKPQVMPKKSKDKSLLQRLSPFLNMDDDMKILFTVNLVQQFICTSSHFVGVISAEKGSGKSTLTKIWHRIIDPTEAEVSIMPKNVEELKNHLANNKVVVFDNTQLLSQEFSDILCGAVTGTAYTKRELYTNSNELVYKLHNTVIINGINVIPTQSDLLDRTMLFKLNSVADEDRKDEETLEEEFNKALPYILGTIFATLSKYFAQKESIKVAGNHRMSGAYKDCYIIATVLGVAEEFVEAFENNQAELKDDCKNSSILVSSLSEYFNKRGKDSTLDYAENVYDELKMYIPYDSDFPNSSSAFTAKLRKEEEFLRKAGFKYCKHPDKKGTWLMINKI